jgi:hypothetical protein
LSGDRDWLGEKLTQDWHELVEVGEVDVVSGVRYRDYFDTRVFASEPLGSFMRNQGYAE